MLPRALGLVLVCLAVFSVATMRAGPAEEFNPAALGLHEAVVGGGRPEMVLFVDYLRRECERDAAGFATRAEQWKKLGSEFAEATRATGTSGQRMEVARRFLSEKVGYEPPGRLALSLHAMWDAEAAEALRQFSRALPGVGPVAGADFAVQLRAMHRASALAREQAALRGALEQTIGAATGRAYRVANEAEAWGSRWSALNDLLAKAQSGGVEQALRGEALRAVLAQARGTYGPVVDQAVQWQKGLLDAYALLKTANPREQASVLASRLPPEMLAQARRFGEDAERAQRLYQVQASLGLAATLAELSGDRRLAGQIEAVSQFYVRTEDFIQKLGKLSAQPNSLGNAAAMAAMSANYVGVALTVLSLFSDSGGGAGDNGAQAMLEELREVRRLLMTLGESMHRRFDLLEFNLARGFGQTLEAIRELRAEQLLTANNVLSIEARLVEFQLQSAGTIGRTAGLVSDLRWSERTRVARRPQWSTETPLAFDDLLTYVAWDSRDRVESGEFDAGSAAVELVRHFGGLTQGRLSAATLGDSRFFSQGNFLRGYFQARHGVVLTPPASNVGVPSLSAWLRGVGVLAEMRARFPALASNLTAEQRARVLAALNDVDGFWQNLAAVKVNGKAPGFTFADSLFEATLDRLRKDIGEIRGATGAAVRQYVGTTHGVNCWDRRLLSWPMFPEEFEFAQPNLPAQNPATLRVAALVPGWDASSGDGVERMRKNFHGPRLIEVAQGALSAWAGGLPDQLSWSGAEAFLRPLFTPAEQLGHRLKLNGAELSARLHRHGWERMPLPLQTGPGKAGLGNGIWVIEIGLYRGGRLLRTVTVRNDGQPAGELSALTPPSIPGMGVTSSMFGVDIVGPPLQYALELRDARSDANWMWAQALQQPLAFRDSGRLLRALRDPSAPAGERTGERNGWEVTARGGEWTFAVAEAPDVAIERRDAEIAERDAIFEQEVRRWIQASRERFLRDYAPSLPAVRDALERYEEDRVAFYTLVNFAAPLSLRDNASLREALYGTAPALPPRGRAITEEMCEIAAVQVPGSGPLPVEPGIGRLRAPLVSEYRAKRFPQSADYVPFARHWFASLSD